MGQRIEIHMEPENYSIVFHDAADTIRHTARLLLGHENPDLVCTGPTFAAAWRKFCDYYPAAG
jgi:hypothetical protein